jgi:hypothetical protein
MDIRDDELTVKKGNSKQPYKKTGIQDRNTKTQTQTGRFRDRQTERQTDKQNCKS